MSTRVEELAAQIAELDEAQQQVVFERAAELSLCRGLKELSDRYRRRLREQGQLEQTAEEILAELKQIRAEIAAREYSG